eukprot:2365385-Pyramimonas_sp.AAC.1
MDRAHKLAESRRQARKSVPAAEVDPRVERESDTRSAQGELLITRNPAWYASKHFSGFHPPIFDKMSTACLGLSHKGRSANSTCVTCVTCQTEVEQWTPEG